MASFPVVAHEEPGSNDPSRRLARALTRLSLRRPAQVLAVGLVVSLVGGGLASRLSLSTDVAELLPPTARSVIQLKKLNVRLGGTGNVAIALESIDGKPEALRRYVPRLAEALKRELGKDLLSIKYQRKEVTDFYARFAAWYVPVDDLRRWTDRLGEAIAREANPALGVLDDLEDRPADAPGAIERLIAEVRADREKVQPQQAADPDTGLLIGEDGRLAVVFVRPAADALNLAGSGGLLARIKQVVASTHPEEAGVRLPPPGYTGSIPMALAEYSAVQRDIMGTTALVCGLVGLVVVLYFRGFRELLLLGATLVVGTAVSMGFASVWIGHVNGQTAFLGSIIVGTGINYGIILLDRYRQARARELPLGEALELACDQSLRATWIAALGTAVSFGVLAAGEVESFRQFGWIGGVGILACWVATFTCVPAALVLLDRGGPLVRPTTALERLLPWSPLPWIFLWTGRALVRFPAAALVLTVASVAAASGVAYQHRGRVIESNIGNLGSKTRDLGMERLDQRLRPMDDRSAVPEIIAADSRQDAIAACQQLLARRHTDLEGVMTNCHTIGDLFPPAAAERPALFARLGRQLDKVPEERLSPAEREEVARIQALLATPAPTDDDLPPSLKEYYLERDGSLGKLAFVDPFEVHLEEKLNRFTDAIRHIELPSGKVVEANGFTVVFADIVRAVRRDTRKLTFLSAVLVMLVLAAVTRSAGTFLRVGGALVAGAIVMVGLAAHDGQTLNFFNFVALPTTFGIGVDYAINIEERLRGLPRRVLAPALSSAAPAVMLASATTIFGYVSLLTADSRALNSFGRLAILGELTCTFFAVTLIPALFALRRSGR